jgi:hypothetical protein
MDKLRQTVKKQGPKAAIGNRGYARFLKVAQGSVTVDEEAVKRDARLDGKFVLTTNTDLPTSEVAQTYKSRNDLRNRLAPRRGFNDLLHVGHGEAVAGKPGPVYLEEMAAIISARGLWKGMEPAYEILIQAKRAVPRFVLKNLD